MLHLIVSTNTDFRIKKRNTILKEYAGAVIALDDSLGDLTDLRAYLFPSLFSFETPIVHARFLVEKNQEFVTSSLIKELLASPTVFVLEEQTLPLAVVKMFEKEKATVFHEKDTARKNESNSLFAVTGAITGKTKKERWLTFRQAVALHTGEALIGILYWKLRSLIASTSKNQEYKMLYTRFIHAHKEAWQKGIPLEIAIEKIILEN